MITTFWLYRNLDPIYAIRLPEESTAKEVRDAALEQHSRTPLSMPTPPATFAMFLYYADIVRG